MNMLKTFAMLAFGSVLLAGCGSHEDESAAQTGAPSPAIETPTPPAEDAVSPADATEIVPSDEAGPAMSDSLPTGDKPPPSEPAPPPGN